MTAIVCTRAYHPKSILLQIRTGVTAQDGVLLYLMDTCAGGRWTTERELAKEWRGPNAEDDCKAELRAAEIDDEFLSVVGW